MAKTTKVKIEADTQENVQQDAQADDAGAQAEAPVDDEAKPDDTIRTLEEKLETAEKNAQTAYDRFLRAHADLENYKKRSDREMADFRKFANESMAKAILPVVDNLELALNSGAGDGNAAERILEGVDLTLKEVLKAFEKFGINRIEALEKPFDPAFHQAVMQEQSTAHPANTVIRELQKGYMIHDRLLRPSMVVVSKCDE